MAFLGIRLSLVDERFLQGARHGGNGMRALQGVSDSELLRREHGLIPGLDAGGAIHASESRDADRSGAKVPMFNLSQRRLAPERCLLQPSTKTWRDRLAGRVECTGPTPAAVWAPRRKIAVAPTEHPRKPLMTRQTTPILGWFVRPCGRRTMRTRATGVSPVWFDGLLADVGGKLGMLPPL